MIGVYDQYIFRPYQSLRNLLFGALPFSLGDLLYFTGAIFLIAVNIRWIYFLLRFPTHKHFLARSLLNTMITFSVIYLLFFIGWGGNYYKPSLASYWQLTPSTVNNKRLLHSYDQYLINRLNDLAPVYEQQPFKKVNERAQQYYRTFTDSRTRMHGLRTKPSFYGFFMQYLGVQGYYNPFTGEAQVNRFLPSFMLPFVICHEMAHQSGIAAEDDANLLSYALCVTSPDKDFSYSGYFNIWLYTHSRFRKVDSNTADSLYKTLNLVTHGHLDTLRAIRKKYRSELSAYSSAIYDGYLRMHNQKDGIDSYYGVILSAWQWEEQRKKTPVTLLRIP